MVPRRLLFLFIVVVALFAPRPVAAQGWGCDLASVIPFQFPGLPWDNQATVMVEGMQLKVRICAPQAESATAEGMLQLVERALPVLDRLTDVRLRGSIERKIVLVDSDELYISGADGSIDKNDLIKLHPGSLRSTVVHELAHYWANGDNFSAAWMVEAYAEYLTERAMQQLDEPYEAHRATAACDNFPLGRWDRTVPETEVCAYAVGPQVFRDLEASVGDANLRQVIGELSAQPGKVNNRSLLLKLEQASGEDLSALMMRRVFTPQEDAQLVRRAELRGTLSDASALAARLGTALPAAVVQAVEQWNFDRWESDQAASALKTLVPLLTAAEATDKRCDELQLDCARIWQNLGDDPAHWQELTGDLTGAQTVLDAYSRLQSQSNTIQVGVPASLRTSAATLEPFAVPMLDGATAALNTAQELEQACAEIDGLSCRSFWKTAWEQGDIAGVNRTIRDTKTALNAEDELEEHCAESSKACRKIWREALDRGGIVEAQAAIDELGTLLKSADAAEQACVLAGWPCASGWRAQLSSGGITAARQYLQDQAALLAELIAAETRLADPNQHDALLAQGSSSGQDNALNQLASARQAFARGDLAEAKAQIQDALYEQEIRGQMTLWGTVIIVIALIALVVVLSLLVIRRIRRSASRQSPVSTGANAASTADDEDLLAQLLTSSPPRP